MQKSLSIFIGALLLAVNSYAGFDERESNSIRLDTRDVVDAGALRGRITGGASRSAIAGASISVAGETVSAGSDGRYSITSLAAGSYTATISAAGYVQEQRPVEIHPDVTATLDLHLEEVSASGERPIIISVDSQHGDVFPVMDGAAVTNQYTARVVWNGAPGSVRFAAPNQTITAAGGTRDAYLSAEFNMRTAFNPSSTLGANWRRSNPLVVTATNGEGLSSPPVTVYPSIFQIPEWVIGLPNADVTLAAGSSGWKFAVDARYPSSPVSGMTNVPSSVPFIGGDFGLESTQAIFEGEFNSASSSGQLTVSGGTGFRSGEMGRVAGEVGGGLGFGLGDDWYVDGIFKAGIEGTVRGRLGILECVPEPTVQTFAKTPPGKVVNDRVALFAEVNPEIDLQVGYSLLSAGEGWDLGFKSTDVELGVGITGGVEIDLSKALYVRGYLGGTPRVLLHFPANPEWFQKAEIDFVTGIHAKTFFDTTLVKAEKLWHVVLYDSAADAREAASGIRGARAEDNAVIITQAIYDESDQAIRGPSVNDNVFMGGRPQRGGGETVFVANAFSEAKPSVAVSDGTKILAYTVDDPDKADLQSTEIFCSLDTGTGWSTPVALTNDTHLDCSPAVQIDAQGDAVVVWLRSRTDSLADPSLVEPEMEVAYAVWDATTESWSAPSFITNNTFIDYDAQLVRADNGSLLLAWAANEGNETVGTTEAPTKILARRWDAAGQSWGAKVTAIQGDDGVGVTEITAAWNGTVGQIVYVRDMDGDFDTGVDTELYHVAFDGAAFGAPLRLTDDTAMPVKDYVPDLLYDSAGNLQLVWLRDDQLRLATGLNIAESITVRQRDGSTGLVGFNLARDAADNLFIIWPDDPKGQADLHYRVYDAAHQVWGEDGTLTNDTGMEKAVSTAFTADGRLLMAYAKTVMTYDDIEVELDATRELVTVEDVPREGATDILLFEPSVGTDLRVSDITVEPQNPAPGTDAQVTVQTANIGDRAQANVKVALYNGDPEDGGTQIGATETLPDPLPGQSTAEMVWTWSVPADDNAHTLFAMADPDNDVEEFVESNNEMQRATVLPDPAIANLSATWLSGDTYEIAARITNDGAVSTGAFTVRFFSEAPGRSVLGQVAVPAVSPAWEDVVTVEIDATGLELPLKITGEIIPEAGTADFTENNNTATLLLQAPIVRTPAAPIELTAKPGVNHVHLAWNDMSEGEDGFRIIRVDNSARGEEEIGFVPAGVTAFTDDTVQDDTQYTYSVFAYNAAGAGERSAPVATTTGDTDEDGMDDDFEQQIVNADPDITTIAHVLPNDDFDNDGFSNLQEYRNGTDPTANILVLQPGWNLVSIAEAPVDNTVAGIFGDAISGMAMTIRNGRLVCVDELLPEHGYWVYCPATDPVEIDLTALAYPAATRNPEPTTRNTYTITLDPGWNCISLGRVPEDNTVAAVLGDAIHGPAWVWSSTGFAQTDVLLPDTGVMVYNPSTETVQVTIE